ncbi:MAG: FAD-dependent thymidylate synthase [Desulfovibrionaceae bacterium]|nr:FAD-dependent thymidylate synthase [Desulfovibrionaceae bacterium]
MKSIAAYVEILALDDGILQRIERFGRVCYKSEKTITEDSAIGFVQRIIQNGHESVLEHGHVSVRFVCDRGITHEIVRHRLASYSQESTRYANYADNRFGREITVIKPCFWQEDSEAYAIWLSAMQRAEEAYLALIDGGAKAEEARSVLPNSLKTELIATANLREWRHILALRCAKRAHPQMREIMLSLLEKLHKRIPVIFDDLAASYLQ